MENNEKRPLEGETVSAGEEQLQEARRSKVESFRLNLRLDDEFGTPDAAVPEPTEAAAPNAAAPQEPARSTQPEEAPLVGLSSVAAGASVPMQELPQTASGPAAAPAEAGKPARRRKKYNRQAIGCAGGVLYVAGVLLISGLLAFFILTGALDMLGINKSDAQIDVEIPEGASTEQVADILKENGLITQKLMFRLFSKVSHADGTYQPGVFTLSGTLGYKGMIEELQTATARATVDVTFPEGMTVLGVAEKLEEYNVCNSDEFLWTLAHGDFSDYDFVAELPPCGEGTERPYRIYQLEGYLFPDTYTFYQGSSPESAVRKFLDNFAAKVNTNIRTSIKAQGFTIDEAVILASILQQEADNKSDMTKVSRVFWNRLHSDEFPHLQSDVTTMYAGKFFKDLPEDSPVAAAYSTYVCDGLPTGAICNPGLDALKAVIHPCEDADIVNCYYFATDLSSDPTVTYYSETYAEHVAICRRYGIGIHG